MALQPLGEPEVGLWVTANGTQLAGLKKKTNAPDPLFTSAIFLPIWDKTLLGCAALQIMAGGPNSSKSIAELDANQATVPLSHSKPFPW